MHSALPLTGDRVVLAGDWHGDGTAARVVIDRAAELGIRTLVHVGDVGIGPWPGERKSFTKLLDRYLDPHGIAMLINPGNHENWDRIDQAPLDEAGMKVVGRHVRVIRQGGRFSIEGRTFGSLGGAVSVDANRRTQGRTWWAQESLLPHHVERLGDDPLDVLVSHDVPAGVPVTSHMTWIPQDLLDRSEEVRELLASAIERTRPHVAFAGHWHQRVIHDLRHDDGHTTTVHVLDKEHTSGNAVVLDLVDLSVRPLREAWNSQHLLG